MITNFTLIYVLLFFYSLLLVTNYNYFYNNYLNFNQFIKYTFY